MDQKYRVVLAHLRNVMSAATIPENLKSKEDPAKQTKAVEKLLKETIKNELPEYSDKVFTVGGFERDRLLGKNPKDIDIVVDDPEDGMKSAEIFAKKLTDALGITGANNPHSLKDAYGIWGIALLNPKSKDGEKKPFIYDGTDISGYVIEATPPRKEGPYKEDKREPEWVDYTSREEDAKRRDLTINAIYRNIVSGKIEDYVGGQKDLKDKRLRPPDHPDGIEKIYEEDPLRIFRLIRFNGKLPEFKVSKDVIEKLKKYINSSEGQAIIKSKLSKERIRDELTQILTQPNAESAIEGLEYMREWNVLKEVSPFFDKMIDTFHDTVYHRGESVWEHTLDVLRRTPPTLKARLAALFHDVGKIESLTEEVDKEGRERKHFYGHENKGPALVKKALKELKFDANLGKSIANIVHSHMGFKKKSKPTKHLIKMRLFIEKLYDDLDDALALLKADAGRNPEKGKTIDELKAQIMRQKEDDIKKGLLVQKQKGMGYIDPMSGDELKEEFETLKDGPAVKEAKRILKHHLMVGDFDSTEEKQRLEKAKKLINSFASNEKEINAYITKFNERINEIKELKKKGEYTPPDPLFYEVK